MDRREVTVRKLLYGGKPGYVWKGTVTEQTPTGVVIEATFDRANRDLGYVLLEQGDRWMESYFFDRWYNVFEIYSREGDLKGWYCNVCTPAQLQEGELTFVDLALDVFAYPDGRYLVLDEDDFARGKATLFQPAEAAAAEQALEQLTQLAQERRLPRRDGTAGHVR